MERNHKESISEYELCIKDLNEKMETKSVSYVLEAQAEELNNLKTQLNHFLKLSAEWETFRTDKNKEIEDLKTQVLEIDDFRQEKQLLEERIKLLEEELEAEGRQYTQREATLSSEVNQLKQQLTESSTEALRINNKMATVIEEKEKLEKENALIKVNLETAEEDANDMLDELERTKAHEKKVFEEKESLKSQLLIHQEEKAILVKEFEELKQKHEKLEINNAKLVSHQNLNQKIHHHMTIKKENIQLKEQLVKLQSKILLLEKSVEKSSKPSERPLSMKNSSSLSSLTKTNTNTCFEKETDDKEGKENVPVVN